MQWSIYRRVSSDPNASSVRTHRALSEHLQDLDVISGGGTAQHRGRGELSPHAVDHLRRRRVVSGGPAHVGHLGEARDEVQLALQEHIGAHLLLCELRVRKPYLPLCEHRLRYVHLRSSYKSVSV